MAALAVAGGIRCRPVPGGQSGPVDLPGREVTVFGPNVCVFNDHHDAGAIQADLDAIASQQVPWQPVRHASATPSSSSRAPTGQRPTRSIFQVGYYTEVAGLGATPGDTVINGAVDVYQPVLATAAASRSDNFWRSLSNLTINVTAPPDVSPVPCPDGTEFWATSQASPIRRVDINGTLTLFDYCTSPSYSSGGFIADSVLHGGSVINGSQQQFIVRNSNIDDWTNSVWNQVFSGDIGAPAQSFGVTPGTSTRRCRPAR